MINHIQIKNRMENDSSLLKEEEVWKALEVGWIKVNCDEAWKKELRKAVIGIVARNEESRMISGMGKMWKWRELKWWKLWL